jgi:predicted nuclease of predicted toxin-antitoxin system
MKLLFDQNISFRILKLLPENLKYCSHVIKEGLLNAQDIQIWEFARKHGYTIVTQDSDFNDLNSLHGFPPKVIWIRTGNIPTNLAIALLLENLQEIENFINDPNYGCFEILRIKRP